MTTEGPDRPAVAFLVSLLQAAASMVEPNEEIAGLSLLHHGLRCADLLAVSDPDDPELQVAGLLHDVGHVLAPGCADVHGAVGADVVRPVLGGRVAALIEGHVSAKRYLVTVDPAYRDRLSVGSRRTLAGQGEAMSGAEAAAFSRSPHFEGAVRLRLADEQAKDPGASVSPLGSWQPTLNRLAR